MGLPAVYAVWLGLDWFWLAATGFNAEIAERAEGCLELLVWLWAWAAAIVVAARLQGF
jgi:hypothetical protein